MCGLLYTNINITKSEFEASLHKMAYRGSDDIAKTFFFENHKLGHNRLTIIGNDSNGTQPMIYQDRFVIVYNGEIYNYLELSKKYNIKLENNSDTELLLKLFIQNGKSMLCELRGMFAFVIFDTVKKDIFVARDRFGIKPLYFYQNNSDFIFSSTVASIISITKHTKINEFSLRQYKKLRNVFNNKTLFSNINIFPAGSYFENGKIIKYWELPSFHNNEIIKPELVKEIIDDSIKSHMVADVDIGCYLSGGLDSSIISSIASLQIPKLKTYTIGFQDDNEFTYSQIMSDFINSDHKAIIIDKEEFLSLMQEMIKIKQEPLSVPNEVLLYKLTKNAKKFNKVILSGEGADEIFFGYSRIFNWARNEKWNIAEFSRLYSYGSNEDIEVVEDAISPFFDKNATNLEIVCRFFQIAHLQGLLKRLDSSSMLANVEARVPFVDHVVVEKLFNINFDCKTNINNPKQLLKLAYQNYIPPEIITRQKIGFPVDISKIISNKYGNNNYDKWLNLNIEIFNNLN